MVKPVILCVDDEDIVLGSLKEQLSRAFGETYSIETAGDGDEALEVLEELDADGAPCPLVVCDQIMPGIKGHELLRQAHVRWPRMKKVMLTGQADAAVVGQAVNEAGLFRFLAKPWDTEDLILTVRSALESYDAAQALDAETERRQQVSRELMRLASERSSGPLLGDSKAVVALRDAISNRAATDDPVLLCGPPGSGLEAAARAIHAESGRETFIFVNCAMVGSADELWDGGRGGSAGLAAGGTLCLHGADRLGAESQRRVAALIGDLTLDARVIAAAFNHETGTDHGLTHVLREAIETPMVPVPPLRERLSDLEELATFFVRSCSRRFGRSAERLSEQSLTQMRSYLWPGNVRELRQVVERAVLRSAGTVAEIGEALEESGASFGSYRLVERIGEGGMGEVWRARHQHLARPAAVKFVRAGIGREDIMERFHREAQATALLRSPHTVELYDFGVADDGRLFFAMELLEGLDLKTLVKEYGPMPPARVVWLLRQACRSLQEAHESGLVHRDIKPANLFACRLGGDLDFLKVLDFGLVASLSAEGQAETTEFISGTPAYMPPEASFGEDVDGRADLYGLGCVAYWLLAGEFVFPRDSMDAMTLAHAKDPPPTLESVGVKVPAAFEAIINDCLAKSPSDRPASASEVHRRLGELDIEPWTEERAAAWWEGKEDAIPVQPPQLDDATHDPHGQATVTVMLWKSSEGEPEL